MNNADFKAHLINILSELGVTDGEECVFNVSALDEPGKSCTGALDDMVRLMVLPRERKMTFDEFVRSFTVREGFYPCRVEVEVKNGKVNLAVSLRMRKAEGKNDGHFYPFVKK